MKSNRKASITLVGMFTVFACISAPLSASAITLTFDDLHQFDQPVNGYNGFNSSNFWAINGTQTIGGYQPSVISPNNVIYNGGGVAASLSSATPFTFNSVYITAAWNDGLQVDVTGLLAGNTLFSTTIAPSATAPTLYTFNWAGIDTVSFNSYGGIQHSGYETEGTHIALDNFTYTNSIATPVPFEFDATLGLSVLGGGFLLRKALKKKVEKV